LQLKQAPHEELHICDGPMTKATSRAHKVSLHGTEVACSLIWQKEMFHGTIQKLDRQSLYARA